MSELTQVRPLELIEAEIRFYAKQSADSMVEVGKRLIEAKEQVQHGEWGKWLEEKVEFSQDVANNFMKIAREFPNSAAVRNLSYRKILAIASVPGDQREEFTENKNLEEMTTRQVEAAVKEWKDKFTKADTEAQAANDTLKVAQKDIKKLMTDIKTEQDSVKRTKIELDKKNKEIQAIKQKLDKATEANNSVESENLRNLLKNAQDEIKALEQQLKDKPIEAAATVTVEVVPEDTQRELEDLRKKAANPATLKYKVYFDELVDTFKKMVSTLMEIKDIDTPAYTKYRNATVKLVAKLNDLTPPEEGIQQDAACSECNCGVCSNADMKEVSDEDLDNCKTFCILDKEIRDFGYSCSNFKSIHNE